MGIFNTISTIGKINAHLKEMEYQLNVISQMLDNRLPSYKIQNELDIFKQQHQQLIDLFGSSRGAFIAVYTFLGRKCRSADILQFTKDTIIDIQSRLS